jgi:amino-acid N-acetyltransferase
MNRTPRVTLRTGNRSDAPKLHALITASLAEGHLLPRSREEIADHAARFVVAIRRRAVVGCAELAPLSATVAEVRSLVVDGDLRGHGVGTRLVDELRERAQREGFEKLCAFTHAPAFFVEMGFSIEPHLWLTEKIFTDCVGCPLFRRCGQVAVVAAIDPAPVTVDHPDATRHP